VASVSMMISSKSEGAPGPSLLGTGEITDTNDATKNQTCTYQADDLSRLKSVDCGANTWAQNFSYDAFGNINKSGSGNYAAAYNALTNQVSGGVAISYDANGNQLRARACRASPGTRRPVSQRR
jgi:hypothetical protein